MIKLYGTIFYLFSVVSLFAQTQADINYEALQEYKTADAKLNEAYKNLLDVKKSDVVFIKNLKTAQRLWIQYRDAQLAIKYPPQKEEHYYKSVLPMLQASFLTELTYQRIGELETYSVQTRTETNDDFWIGLWYGGVKKEASLSINKNSEKSYILLCKGPNGEWEGIGYELRDQLIAIFSYKESVDKGYFTMTLKTPKSAEFTTYSPNGLYRSNGVLRKD